MNSWLLFLQYAKTHDLPKSKKELSKIYQDLKNSCFCGDKNKMCSFLGFLPKVKNHDIKDAILEGKVKALEEKSKHDDEYISLLESKLHKVSKKVNSV